MLVCHPLSTAMPRGWRSDDLTGNAQFVRTDKVLNDAFPITKHFYSVNPKTIIVNSRFTALVATTKLKRTGRRWLS